VETNASSMGPEPQPGGVAATPSLPRRYYITTPIYYVNDVPHIGHAYTTITADALARWHRLRGDDVFFLTGTDEHGLKVQRAAEANGLTPREHADRTSERFRETWRLLDISNDDFIRTTEPRHYQAVQKLLQKVYDNGWIELNTYEGLYCVSCEAYFVADDLLDGNRCPIHRRPVELFKEDNYFFKLSAFEQPLLDWYASHPDMVSPEPKRNEAIGLIRQGLQDISISRTSINWGVPVPWDPGHVFYVWYDALINYATAVGYGSDRRRFDTWWPAVHHLIGKDILRFHTVYWPAMLMAAGEMPPAHVHVHGFLLVGGEKMSKTAFNQIAPADLVPEFGIDGYRYHFLRDTVYGRDGEFSYEGMVARYNADLANGLGNLLSRVTSVVSIKCDGIGPAAPRLTSLSSTANDVIVKASLAWEAGSPSEALAATWELVRATNTLLEKVEPWRRVAGTEVSDVLGEALEALRIISVLIHPAMPHAANAIWERIGLPGRPDDTVVPEGLAWGAYPGDLPVSRGASLFPRKDPNPG
jgi:methionyl-tRNA synthetase